MKKLLILIFLSTFLFANNMQKQYFLLGKNLKNETNSKVIFDKLYKFYLRSEKYKDSSEQNFDLYISLQIAFDEFYPAYKNKTNKNDCTFYVKSLKNSLNPKYEKNDSFGDIYDTFIELSYKACILKDNMPK